MVPVVTPQLVGNNGLQTLRLAIGDPERFAFEPKVDGVRGLVVYQPDGSMESRNRRGERRDWLRRDAFEGGLRRLANRLPILWDGTVLDGELIASRFAGTMAALHGSKTHRDRLRFVVFDVPVLAGVDLRALPWQARRERLELLAEAFDVPLSSRLWSSRHAGSWTRWRTAASRASSSRTGPRRTGVPRRQPVDDLREADPARQVGLCGRG
jgi:ATP-dependent DNA ligase